MKLTQIKNIALAGLFAGLLILGVGVLLQKTLADADKPGSGEAAATNQAPQNKGEDPKPVPLPKPEPWNGFLSNTTLPNLPNPAKVNNKYPFKIGVIQDAKTFNTVAAGVTMSAKGQDKVLPRWSKEIDWNREMVAYVVLTNSTNALKYKGFQMMNKRGELLLNWIGIEPLYNGRQYALLCRFPRSRLTQLSVIANDGKLQHLADIQIMPK